MAHSSEKGKEIMKGGKKNGKVSSKNETLNGSYRGGTPNGKVQ